ncbi:S9 family peptidase [Myroides sp. LJL110]
MNKDIVAPVAKKLPVELKAHGDIRIDNYFWLNQRQDPQVIQYLEQENQYYTSKTAHTKGLQDSLFEEMKSRINQKDSSVPYFYNGYYYITRFETGKDYPIYTRKKGSLDQDEEILFDCNQLAKGHSYFHLRGINVSQDNQWVAYGIDTVSRREYTLYIKNLVTNQVLDYGITNTDGSSTWAGDNKTLFYSRKDPETLRVDRIFKHKIGWETTQDELVYFEKDQTFDTFIGKEKSHCYLVIGSQSTLTSEYQILEADNPDGEFRIFQKRKRGLEYSISHYAEHFYILTNYNKADNFQLMRTPVQATSLDNWTTVIGHRKDVLLESIDIFKDYLVISERFDGLPHIKIQPWDNAKASYYLPFESQTYDAYTGMNIDFDTPILRYCYQSLATPASVIDFNMQTHEKQIKKQQEVLGDFNTDNYTEQRLWATAKDGVKVPISIVYRKGLQQNSNNACLLYAYGSYGMSMEPYFSSTRLSLLDRGFIYAIAHVRGGEEMGRWWYEDGKLLHKKNTFNDFIACSEYLIQQGFTNKDKLYAQGGSAGGMLMGVIANQAGDLYNGILAQVPFVDVVTTMLDSSIPLTTGEYDEWGNPEKKKYYDYMLSYSPYDNVKAQDYPNMYISTGFHDSQVQYWEPAKWVAKLRELKTNDKQLFLDTNMQAGHGGASGRFEALREIAKEFSFMLDLEGITK